MSSAATAATVIVGRTGPTQAEIDAMATYDSHCDDLAATAGILNAAHGHLVDLAISCLDAGGHVGPGLHSFAHFLAWRLGISVATARTIERVARRAHDLPILCTALRAGEISLEQAAVVATNMPAAYDASATDLAKVATVAQLKAVLPAYRQRPTAPKRSTNVSVSSREDGTTRIGGTLDTDQGALVAKALGAMRDTLLRQRQADARAHAAETGEPEAKVAFPSSAEALAALAETALQATEAAHPGTERCLISYHLQATQDGRLFLTDEHGLVVDEAERRRLLCDHQYEHVFHGPDGTPLSVGRKTRHIDRRLRRAILHRHHGRCAVPGCANTHGLEIHHITHWEDGGSTDTANLLPLCRHHHRAHHQGLLHIEGNADLPAGAPGSIHIGPPGRRLEPAGTPEPVPPPPSEPIEHLRDQTRCRLHLEPPPQARIPLGERLDRHTFHLNAEPDSPPNPPDPGEGSHPLGTLRR